MQILCKEKLQRSALSGTQACVINGEITMGHDIGVSSSYYRPQEKEVLADY